MISQWIKYLNEIILKNKMLPPFINSGTGKTYASAFAMRELGFQRVLFLVHRNQIAKQAKKSFRKVFSGQVSMGLVTGKYQEYDKDFIFATIQTLSKEENLHRYEKNSFDAIVIDDYGIIGLSQKAA